MELEGLEEAPRRRHAKDNAMVPDFSKLLDWFLPQPEPKPLKFVCWCGGHPVEYITTSYRDDGEIVWSDCPTHDVFGRSEMSYEFDPTWPAQHTVELDGGDA